MGLKANNSPVNTRLSKMVVAIENIVSFATANNLVVNQLMEREATIVVITKAVSIEEPSGPR